MRCPKDADIYKDLDFELFFTYCNKINPNSTIGWPCTRRKGHRGKHHSHIINSATCLDIWGDIDAMP